MLERAAHRAAEDTATVVEEEALITSAQHQQQEHVDHQARHLPCF